MLPPELQQKLAAAQKQLEQYRQALLADEEQARKRASKKAAWIACVCVALLLAAGAAGLLFRIGTAEMLALLVVIAIGGAIASLLTATKPVPGFFTAYEDTYKTEINNAIVKHFSPALAYIEEDGINRETFESSGLFATKPNRYGTSDLVSGTHGGNKTQLQLARVFAGQLRTTGGSVAGKGASRTISTTIFDGVLLVVTVNQPFKGHTFVLWNETIIPTDAVPPFDDRLTQLGNPDFEREFAVYTDAPEEARRNLTAQLMEHMLALKRRPDTAMMRFSFKDSSINIALEEDDDDNNPFDPDFDKPATDAAQLERIYEHFAFYLGIVDGLDLNTHIGPKE